MRIDPNSDTPMNRLRQAGLLPDNCRSVTIVDALDCVVTIEFDCGYEGHREALTQEMKQALSVPVLSGVKP